MKKYIYSIKEVAAELKVNPTHLRNAVRLLKLYTKIGSQYMLNKKDYEKIKELYYEANPYS